jgi:hypothetical protein
MGRHSAGIFAGKHPRIFENVYENQSFHRQIWFYHTKKKKRIQPCFCPCEKFTGKKPNWRQDCIQSQELFRIFPENIFLRRKNPQNFKMTTKSDTESNATGCS